MALSRRERFAKQYHSPGFVFYTHSQRCVVPGCHDRRMDACHYRTKGNGGTWRDVFPGCHVHHMEQGSAGVHTFQRRYDVELDCAVDEHVASWEALSDAEREQWESEAADHGYKWPRS